MMGKVVRSGAASLSLRNFMEVEGARGTGLAFPR